LLVTCVLSSPGSCICYSWVEMTPLGNKHCLRLAYILLFRSAIFRSRCTWTVQRRNGSW
jgi:hypothetical protein